MKAYELMMGDWVYNSKHEICKVHAISQVFDSNITLDNYSKENDGTFELEFEVDPIPLTEEIMENNFNDGTLSWHAVDYPMKSFVIEYIEEGVDANDIIIRLEYVHELQHFLKLCQIPKRIIL